MLVQMFALGMFWMFPITEERHCLSSSFELLQIRFGLKWIIINEFLKETYDFNEEQRFSREKRTCVIIYNCNCAHKHTHTHTQVLLDVYAMWNSLYSTYAPWDRFKVITQTDRTEPKEKKTHKQHLRLNVLIKNQHNIDTVQQKGHNFKSKQVRKG